MLRMHVCFGCVRFSFSVLRQEIGWEEKTEMTYFVSLGRITLIQSINTIPSLSDRIVIGAPR